MLSPEHKALRGVPFSPIPPQDLAQAILLSDPPKLGIRSSWFPNSLALRDPHLPLPL